PGSKGEKSSAEIFFFEIFTGHPARVVTAETRDSCYVQIGNRTTSRWRFQAKLQVFDLEGRPVGDAQTVGDAIGAKSRRFYKIPVPEKYGIYYVHADIMFPEQAAANHQLIRSFAYFPPAGHKEPYRKGQFRFGVNTHWGQDPARWTIEAEACRTVGVRFIRDGFSMVWINPRPGFFHHNFFDPVIEIFRNHGIATQLLLSGAAPWGLQRPEARPERGMPKLEIWRDFCREIFRHYGSKVAGIEIWNEPDLETFASFSPEEYAQLARIAREEQQKYAPSTPLFSAGFCNFTTKDKFHEKAMALCRNQFDVHCFHGHGVFKDYQYVMDRQLLPMRKRLKIDKTMPWYAHETALTATGFGEKAQAEALFCKLLFSWARGSIGYTWYDLRNDGFDLKNPEHNYGLLTRDDYPKAAYVVYNTLTSLFAGDTVFERDLSPDPGMLLLLFRKDRDLLLAAWRNSNSGSGELLFETDAKQTEQIDLMGNVSKLPRHGASLVRLPLGAEPTILKLTSASKCLLRPGVLASSQNLLLLQGDGPQKLPLICRNPFAGKRTFSFGVEVPRGVKVVPPAPVTLAPGEARTISVPFEGQPETVSSGSFAWFSYRTDCAEVGNWAIGISACHTLQPMFPKEPYAQLNRRDQVVELFDADPGNVSRLWKGAEDLSAKIYVAATSEEFHLRVVVTDDLHRQGNRAESLWKGDSMQLYLAIPGQSGVWQFGCALKEQGEVIKYLWESGDGLVGDPAMFSCRITRSGTQTCYDVTVPWKKLRVTPKALAAGIRFNLLINESDSDRRESWMQLAPGVGGAIDASVYPLLRL
ncbi:MAG: hypothetical protein PHS41_06535, partial [Victivallaceae bacterium]|nr:hypothetical protein [Victivallaceae bacterium]